MLLNLNSQKSTPCTAAGAIINKGVTPGLLIECLETLNLNLPAKKIREMGSGVASSSVPRAPGYTMDDMGLLTRSFQLASLDGLRQLLEVCGLFSAVKDPTHVALTLISAATPQDEIIRILDTLQEKRAADYLRSSGRSSPSALSSSSDQSPPTDRSVISNYDTPVDRPEMQDERTPVTQDERGVEDVRKILCAFGVAVPAQEVLFAEGLDIYTIDGLDDAMLTEAGVPKIRRLALLRKLQSIKKEVGLN